MNIQLTPAIYVALRGLVQDALEHPSDATPLLERAANELAHADETQTIDRHAIAGV